MGGKEMEIITHLIFGNICEHYCKVFSKPVRVFRKKNISSGTFNTKQMENETVMSSR